MINPLVMAELEKSHAEAKRRLEQVLATQRSTPTIGRSQTQLSLQRRVKELQDQVDGWQRVIVAARCAELEDQKALPDSHDGRKCSCGKGVKFGVSDGVMHRFDNACYTAHGR